MTFWGHLEELRKVILRILAAITFAMAFFFCFKDFVFGRIILEPLSEDFFLYRAAHIEVREISLINTELAAQFLVHVKISFYMSAVFCTPYILYQLWGFVRPALYTEERKAVRGAFATASLLFYAGTFTGYALVFPLTLMFLGTYHVSPDIPNMISLTSYIGMFIRLVLVMGVVFEMPALVTVLSRIGLVDRKMMKKYRKHAAVGLLFLSAVITPSGDAFTMVVVALPLYLLYELSILLCKK